MSTKIYEKFLKLEKKRQQLSEQLFSIKEMIQGSFCLIHVKCGRSSCKCNQGRLHPHYRMSMRREGKQVSRAVPKEEHEWIAKVTDNYREYRRLLRSINKLDNQIKDLLDAYGKESVKKSSKKKSYLQNFGRKNEKATEKLTEEVF